MQKRKKQRSFTLPCMFVILKNNQLPSIFICKNLVYVSQVLTFQKNTIRESSLVVFTFIGLSLCKLVLIKMFIMLHSKHERKPIEFFFYKSYRLYRFCRQFYILDTDSSHNYILIALQFLIQPQAQSTEEKKKNTECLT